MNPGDGDTGQPVREIANLEMEPSAGFVKRVRGKVERRAATAQLATYSWQIPKLVMKEMAGLAGHFVSSFASGKDRRQ